MQTMTATIQHETKNTYRVSYETTDGYTGSCLARGENLETAQENFKKHYRAKKYQVKWGPSGPHCHHQDTDSKVAAASGFPRGLGKYMDGPELQRGR